MPEQNNNELGILTTKLGVLHDDVNEIKAALSKLSDAITKLALVEERQTQTSQALERSFVGIERIETRLASLERTAPEARRAAHWIDRAMWAAAAAIAVLFARKTGLIP